jgi:hypothetical protein
MSYLAVIVRVRLSGNRVRLFGKRVSGFPVVVYRTRGWMPMHVVDQLLDLSFRV